MKEGAIIVVVGYQGSGKSPWVKAKARRYKNRVVYDRRVEYPTNEYTVFYNLQAFKKFISVAENSCIIAEEATGYVSAYKEKNLTDVIIGIEHNNNVFFLLFHSIMDAPEPILRISQFVVVFPTADQLKQVLRNRPKLLPAFLADKKQVKGSDGKMWNVPVIVDYKKPEVFIKKI